MYDTLTSIERLYRLFFLETFFVVSLKIYDSISQSG